ncbi:DUF4870 domain-containing protein [Chloroflexota bacterium]
MEKTSMGLDENIAGLLCYVLVWISGLAIYLLETENKFVRFHALQSIIAFGALMVTGIILGWIPVIGVVIGWAVSVLSFILWIVLMVKAYQGIKYKLPVIGDIAEKRVE